MSQFEAWTKFEERGVPGITGERRRLWDCDNRFVVVAAGRRSGKSILSRRRLVLRMVEDKKAWNDPRYFYAAPTQGQVKRLAWEDFKRLIPKPLIKASNESELWLKLWNGAELYLLGLDAPQRIEGTPWDGGIIDERADIKLGAWDANIRPALSDRKGWCWHIGVPDMQKAANSEFKELFDIGASGEDPEWTSFTWPSADVLDESEIESAKRRMTPEIFRQEYFASWESMPGRAYYLFTRAEHVKHDELFDINQPLLISCDFNFGHHNWGLYQFNPVTGEYSAIDEVYLPNAIVQAMCKKTGEIIMQMLRGAGRQPDALRDVVFYGDYSGEQRNAAATDTAWRQIKDYFNKWIPEYTGRAQTVMYQYRPAPLIHDRVNLMNSHLKNANGDIRLRVSHKCVNLIRDLESVTMELLFSDRKSALLSHASDNCGYMLEQHARAHDAERTMRKLRAA